MKKDNPIPALLGMIIFGMFFLIASLTSEQMVDAGMSILGMILLALGSFPFLMGAIVLFINRLEAKKQGEKTGAHKENRNGAKAQKSCCARCGVDLSLIPFGKTEKIDGKKYCDVCGKIVRQVAHNKTSPSAEPKKKTATVPETKKHVVCARCKRLVLENQSTWIDNHRFCGECARPFGYEQEKTAKMKAQRQQVQRLINVLSQIQRLPQEKHFGKVCSVCGQPLLENQWAFVDGKYFCEDCCGTIYNKGNRKAQALAPQWHQISYEISGIFGQSLHMRVVEVADRLIAGGFDFCRADVGGGINEISHSSVMAYGTSYRDYGNFKRNMEHDFRKKEEEEREQSGGRVTSLDYGYICAYLARNTLKVCILSECGHIILRWIDTSERFFPATGVFTEEVIKEAFDERCVLTQIDNMELRSDFLSKWD